MKIESINILHRFNGVKTAISSICYRSYDIEHVKKDFELFKEEKYDEIKCPLRILRMTFPIEFKKINDRNCIFYNKKYMEKNNE